MLVGFALSRNNNQAFVATCRSAGKSNSDPPVNPPRLNDEIEVAPNGRCFTNCCLAAVAPENWMDVARKPDGSSADLQKLIEEDDQARICLLTLVCTAGMPGARVGELVQGAYAEASDFDYFAVALGGCICVVPPVGDTSNGIRYFGAGPLTMKVQLYYLHGCASPHFKLLQTCYGVVGEPL